MLAAQKRERNPRVAFARVRAQPVPPERGD